MLSTIHPHLSVADYHASPGISHTSLCRFAESPRHYHRSQNGVPEKDTAADDADEEDDKGSRLLGTLTHLAILAPTAFGDGVSHHVKPDTFTDPKTKEVKKWNGRAQPCRTWLAMCSDKPCLTTREHRRILGARDAVLAHPLTGPMLAARGANEVSVFARHPRTGLTLRVRPDRLTTSADGRAWVFDLKTFLNVRRFPGTARERRYDIQAALTLDVLALAGIPAQFAFISVELTPRYGLHAVRVFLPDDATLEQARRLYERELDELAMCTATNEWPLRHNTPEPLHIPRSEGSAART
jgi:hypothetical protein